MTPPSRDEARERLAGIAQALDDLSWSANIGSLSDYAAEIMQALALLSPEQGSEATVVRIGAGEVIVDTGGHLGVPAVFIEPAPAPGPLGETPNPPLPPHALQPGTVVLQIVSDVSVLIDALNKVASALPAPPTKGGE